MSNISQNLMRELIKFDKCIIDWHDLKVAYFWFLLEVPLTKDFAIFFDQLIKF